MSVEVWILKRHTEIVMSASRDQRTHFNLLIQKVERKIDVRAAQNLQKFGTQRAVTCFTWCLVLGGLESAFITLHVRDRLPDQDSVGI